MFRIRRIFDDATPANREAIEQVLVILKAQFSALSERDVAKLVKQLRDPLKYQFHARLLCAEGARGNVRGFALLLHAPDLNFAYLEYVAAAPGTTSGGIGGALYQRVREEALALDAKAVVFECLPDDPALSPDPVIRQQNVARLRFYERFGARPLANSAYETPVKPDDTDPPYLVIDMLGREGTLSRDTTRGIIRAILDRKYKTLCPKEYVEAVVASVVDDPIQLRKPRYTRAKQAAIVSAEGHPRIALVVNDLHTIHHVRERGYVEAPVRIRSILNGIGDRGWFERLPVKRHSEKPIKQVHAHELVDYLRRACRTVPNGKSVYPYVFPLRNATRPPRELPLRAGYYCIDTFTPLNQSAYLAARGAVDCALTAADAVSSGRRFAYALVRPPGHHAERRAFGGFCYFNSSTIAAQTLSQYGKVAVLDVDYHHGNGTQDIFYERSDVLTVSLHGTPRLTYPYFSGFANERGAGSGKGFNVNIPLPEGIDGVTYRRALDVALQRIRRFRPAFLVVALGFDTAKGDPTGSCTLDARDFADNGQRIASLGVPTLLVQEGGYRVRSLAANARAFFKGLLGLH